jgi:hypothetical protein
LVLSVGKKIPVDLPLIELALTHGLQIGATQLLTWDLPADCGGIVTLAAHRARP